MPRSIASENDRRQFAEQRDQLFALCTAQEQRCLIGLASWYESHRDRLFRDNPFAGYVQAAFTLRYQSWMLVSKPHPALAAWIRTLGWVGRGISAFDNRIVAWSQQRCISVLRASVTPRDDDVLLGVVDFLRQLPLHVGGPWVQKPLQEQLAALTTACMASSRVSASRRMDAAMRCIDRSYRPENHSLPDASRHVRQQCWPLLLELAQEDMQAALHIVDEQQSRRGKANGFSTMDLHEAPRLASQLALILQPHRPVFAVMLLHESITYTSFQRNRLTGEAAAGLERVMDESCRVLAEWITPERCVDDEEVLAALRQLFQHGNPTDAYWAALPQRALEIICRLPTLEGDRRLSMLALVAFYCEAADPASAEKAHRLFDEGVRVRFENLQLEAWDRERDSDDLFSTVGHAVWELSRSLQVLEDKQGSMRNHRIAAAPGHPLARAFEVRLDQLAQRLLAQEPGVALHQLARIAAYVRYEALFRKHQMLLREQISLRAGLFPEDAGRALKTVIQSTGYSAADDELYRKTLCKETFETMLPLLESLSPDAAAHARTGVGWSPRPDI